MSCLLLSLLESITIKFDCLLLYMMMYFKVAISAGVCMQCQKTCCSLILFVLWRFVSKITHCSSNSIGPICCWFVQQIRNMSN